MNQDLFFLDANILNKLNKAGINSLDDLIQFFPKRYDIIDPVPISTYKEGLVTLYGEVVSNVASFGSGFRKTLFFKFKTDDKEIKVYAFGRSYLKYQIHKNNFATIFGYYNKDKNSFTLERFFDLYLEKTIIPTYKISGVNDNLLRDIVKNNLENFSFSKIVDLPIHIRNKYRLIDIKTLFIKSHFPKNLRDLNDIKRRLKYEELLKLNLNFERVSSILNEIKKEPVNYKINLLNELRDNIPYELTNDQNIAINTILTDLKSSKIMNRLLEGDTGSGKTVVSLFASLAVVSDKRQVSIMVPNVILAKQHFLYFSEMLKKFSVNVSLLTSEQKKAERDKTISGLEDGSVSVVIGTSSILSSEVIFKNLGLIIIDEQHRFGVESRNKLVYKEKTADKLYMSATPIPRTLGLTRFCDLDISLIKEKPPGKKEVKTVLITEDELQIMIDNLKEEIKNEHQAFLIVPAITKSETLSIYDTAQVYSLIKEYFNENIIGIIHSKMAIKEKNKIIADFLSKKKKILISTTVIEVGIDIKNASFMCIFNSERFGISQIHQLRGRIGRNKEESICYLQTSDKTLPRLETLERVSDGFILAEEDLKLRGPGDYFGLSQSGKFTPSFFTRDKELTIYKYAKEDAKIINNSKSFEDLNYLHSVIKISNLKINLN